MGLRSEQEIIALIQLAEFTHYVCNAIRDGKVKRMEMALTLIDIAHDIMHETGVYETSVKNVGETEKKEDQ